MAFVARRVTVAVTATLITQGSGDTGPLATSAFAGSVKNLHATATVYVGGSGVTTATGYPLNAGDVLDVGELGQDDALYGIVASSTASVAVLEVA